MFAGWERGRLARKAALGARLALALTHEGRGDSLASFMAWFRMAGLIAADAG